MDSKGNGVEKTPSSSYTIVQYKGSDLPEQYKALVFSKWLRSLRYGNEYFKLIDQEIYFSVYHRYIEVLLSRNLSSVYLAVLSDDRDVVLGFSVTEPGKLHYVHTHKDQRKQGIARSLCKDIKTVTHITNDGLKAWAKHPEIKFNPFEG